MEKPGSVPIYVPIKDHKSM